MKFTNLFILKYKFACHLILLYVIIPPFFISKIIIMCMASLPKTVILGDGKTGGGGMEQRRVWEGEDGPKEPKILLRL